MSAVAGVWTPRAEVLCGRCHGSQFPDRTLTAAQFERWCKDVVDVDVDTGLTRCDRCDRTVVVDGSVAAYARLRDRLHDQSAAAGAPAVVAKLEQTGGMCSALSVRRAGQEAPIVFVSGLDECGLFTIGLYPDEDAVYEGGPTEAREFDNEDATAGAVRMLLLGGA